MVGIAASPRPADRAADAPFPIYAPWGRSRTGGMAMVSLLPWRQAGSISELTGESLRRRGVRVLLADLDNTLVRYSDQEPSAALTEWLADLTAHGVTLFLLSNSRKPARAAHFAQALGVDYLDHAGKPKTGGFAWALARCGARAEDCAMVGDQVFTDVLGANLAGVRAILVEPIRLAGNPGRYLRYWAELPARLLSRKRTWDREEEG